MRTPPAPERRVFVDRELLRAAEELRSRGNELFRAGRFAESEVLYSDAIGLLPKGASELLNLHNNRAVARYKMGEYLLCTEDCTQAQILEPGESKSLLRRAMAWEGLEKWSRAIADYNQLLSSQPGLSGAVQGLSRCRKADADPFAGFEPHFQSRSGASTPGRPQALDDLAAMVSPAVERLKLEEASAALREAEQSTLKDAVDSKIAAWLGKRENNIRALLSSLDQVLWPELGVQNSALSDLMTPAQVKKHYMRVITRTHPDKIHPDESTERKMIASAVFAALNGAYASFDQ
ncbi:DnaJ domain-containing protein [Hyaloraphidium curvatum]|nr:DnaJ domain-containing protein [Hyaloraphidium curvatum]